MSPGCLWACTQSSPRHRSGGQGAANLQTLDEFTWKEHARATTNWHCVLLKRRRTCGCNSAGEDGGFSQLKWPPASATACKSKVTKVCTACEAWSCSDWRVLRPGRPKMCSASRTAGGPAGRARNCEWFEHGGAAATKPTQPERHKRGKQLFFVRHRRPCQWPLTRSDASWGQVRASPAGHTA